MISNECGNPQRPAVHDHDLERFAAAIEAIGREARRSLGEEDLAYIRKVRRVSRASGAIGRALCAVSLEPVGFALGVAALAVHRILEVGEIGHSVLHGAYDELDPTGELSSRTFVWEFPIDEKAWRFGHNARHHRYTGIVGQDADTRFGFLRLAREAPRHLFTYVQLPATVFGGLPYFGMIGQLHFTGFLDLIFGNGAPNRFNFIPDRRLRTVVATTRRAFDKPLRYCAKNYLARTLVFGPLAPKVIVGTWFAERLRDVWAGVVILCGHTGPEVAAFPYGTSPRSRGEFYKMQVEATNDFETPAALSILAGGLDRQIEHHLFPDLPPNRIRAIAADVRRACEAHGVRYRTAPFGRTIVETFKQIGRLSRAD